MHRPTVVRFAGARATAVALLSILAIAPASADEVFATESARLAEEVRAGLVAAGFNQLVDFDNVVEGSAQPQQALPNVDVAVIELDQAGAVISCMPMTRSLQPNPVSESTSRSKTAGVRTPPLTV